MNEHWQIMVSVVLQVVHTQTRSEVHFVVQHTRNTLFGCHVVLLGCSLQNLEMVIVETATTDLFQDHACCACALQQVACPCGPMCTLLQLS